MQRYFLEVKKFAESKYPELRGNISGGLYPPPLYAELFAALMSYVWTIGIMLILGVTHIFKALGVPEPQLITWISNNKGNTFVILFLLNSVANSMVATGAFEVYLNDIQVYSKLASHRFPAADELVSAFAAHGLSLANM
jgi:selT/selW/selH-like putative selenoprotein